jgi:23S rRNA (cytosine1962-C5)-methyltransferase
MPRSRPSTISPAALHPQPAPQTFAAGIEPAAIPVAVVTRRAAERLRAGHPWVYRTDVAALLPARDASEVPPGALAELRDMRGASLGTALYSSASMIALRKISDVAFTTRAEFLALLPARLHQAIALRKQLLATSPQTNACRLVFSEADALPGIILDRYDDLFLLQLLTQATYADDVRAAVVDAVLASFSAEEIASIVERPDPRMRELEQLGPPPSAPLFAQDAAQPKRTTTFSLNGLEFSYDADAGQKTGAFLDQRENYAAAACHARGRALDICTYQGGFALHLARVCEQVTGVDASRSALEVAEKNQMRNADRLLEQGRGVEWIEANAFDLLRDWSDAGQRFGTIVLDPPAFAKSKRAAESALRGYKEMNLRALKMLEPGGTLVTCSCSHHVSLADFTAVVAAAAADAGRRVRVLETRGATRDHPHILTIPETQYLKCLICSVE